MDDFGVPQKFQETSMCYPGPGLPSFAVSLASFFLILIQAMLTEWLVAYCEHTGSLTQVVTCRVWDHPEMSAYKLWRLFFDMPEKG